MDLGVELVVDPSESVFACNIIFLSSPLNLVFVCVDRSHQSNQIKIHRLETDDLNTKGVRTITNTLCSVITLSSALNAPT